MPKNQKAVTERTGGRHGDQPFNDKRNQSAKVGIQFHVGCAAYIADTLGVEAKNLLGRRMATCADKIGPYRPVRSYRGGEERPFLLFGALPLPFSCVLPARTENDGLPSFPV